MNEVASGAVEPIQIYATDLAGEPLTGSTALFVRVMRDDGTFLDFGDGTFKASGWTTRDVTLIELDAVLAPGLYELPGGLDTAPGWAGYVLTVIAGGPSSAVLPCPGELRVGGGIDKLCELWAFRGLDPLQPLENLKAEIGSPGYMRVPFAGSYINVEVEKVSESVVRLTRQ